MKLSNHALERWCSRFPTLMLYDEWSQAKERGISKRLLNKLRRHTTIAKGHQYYISPRGVVFVTAERSRVVTVFQLPDERK